MSKLNNWFITFISRKKIICYDEYNQDMEDTQLCGVGNGYGCGDGYGEENGEVFAYTFYPIINNFISGCGSSHGDESGRGSGDGYGYDNGCIIE